LTEPGPGTARAGRAPRPGSPRWPGGPRGRDRQRWLAGAAAAAGAAGLAAAVAVVSVTTLGQHPAPPPGLDQLVADAVSHVGAVRLLLDVADAAARPQQVAVTGSKFTYLESMVSFDTDGSSPAPAQTHLRQSWTPAADLCHGGLVIEYGRRFGLPAPAAGAAGGGSGRKCPDRGSLDSHPTYPLLRSLPASPQALLRLVRPARDGRLPRDEVAFSTIGAIQQSVVLPKVNAALYRAAALIPEITLVPSAADAAGRPGVAVLFTYQAAQIEWIFDRRTLKLLGELDFSGGTLTGETAILDRAIVNHAGQVPASG
jgi:hypothetical protein